MYEALRAADTALLVVDIQDRLMQAISNRDEVIRNAGLLVRLSDVEAIPRVVTTQYAKGIGPIVPELAELLGADCPVADKTEFSCLANAGAAAALDAIERRRLVITGVEAHICIYQTAAEACAAGYDVTVVADAVGSRAPANRTLALERLREFGVSVLPTEAVIYEILGKAGTPSFKAMLPYLK